MEFAVVIATEAPMGDPVLYRGDVIKSAEKARTAGCSAVEIHARSAKELDLDALLSYCGKTGMKIAALATGMAKRIDKLCFIDDSEVVRDEAIKRVNGFIEFAAPLSAGIVIGSLRGKIPDKSCRKKWDDRFYYCMGRLLETAEKRGVPIFLEVINRYENNYLNTAAETLEFIRPLGSKLVKLHLDTYHMNIEETDMCEAIKISGDALGHIHLADNTRYYPGSGTIDFKSVLDAAKSIGYNGYYSFEYVDTVNPDGTLRAAIEYLNALDI